MSEQRDSSQRTVMLTGAAGNLGRAVATLFHDSGANVVLLDLQRDSLVRAFGVEDERRLFAPANLLVQGDVDAAVAAAIGRFGRIDALCNLAGGFRMGDVVHETSDATWDFVFDINLRTVLNMARAVVPRMIERGAGSIVNVGAFSARQGLARMSAYCAAKQAVERLSESMSAELRGHGIRVNCVLPSVIDTPDNRAAMPESDPAGWVSPVDIAHTIFFLASPQSRAIDGTALPLTGHR